MGKVNILTAYPKPKFKEGQVVCVKCGKMTTLVTLTEEGTNYPLVPYCCF